VGGTAAGSPGSGLGAVGITAGLFVGSFFRLSNYG
jgi:hypothetical protein